MAHTCRIRLKGSAVADLKFFASPRVGCGAAPPGERFCYDREGDQPRKLHVCPSRHGIVVGSRVRGRSRDARPGVSSLLPVTPHTPTSCLEGRRHYAALADDVHGAQHEQPARLVRVAVWRIRFGFGAGRVRIRVN